MDKRKFLMGWIVLFGLLPQWVFSDGPVVEVISNRVSVAVENEPVKDFLRLFCEKLDCNLYADPGITQKISLKFNDQPPAVALAKALKTVDYMITWKTQIDPDGERKDRIEAISVFREGHQEEVIPLMVKGEPMATRPVLSLDPNELRKLADALAEGSDPEEAGKAAMKLAQAGSRECITALLDALPVWDLKQDLSDPVSRAVLSITNRAAIPDLLREYLAEDDENIVLAVKHLLSRMADQAMLDSIVNAYGEADPGVRDKFLDLIDSVTSKDAEKSLMKMAGSPEVKMETPIQRAAIRGLANLGSAPATDHLLKRLEKSEGEDSAILADLVRSVAASQQSVAALRNAAVGNKWYKSDNTRVAAIKALGRFQDRRTMDLLDQLAKDSNAAIAQAALAVLAGGGLVQHDEEQVDQ